MNRMNHIEIIYQEDSKQKIVENNLFDFIYKKCVCVIFVCESGITYYECLNVGKSINVGSEILYDVACLKLLNYNTDKKDGLLYINQFAEGKGFNYEPGKTQEFLYPYINSKYRKLVFIYVWNDNNEDIEKNLAWILHASFWRDKAPFRKLRENYYDNNKDEMLKTFKKYENNVNLVVKEVKKILENS